VTSNPSFWNPPDYHWHRCSKDHDQDSLGDIRETLQRIENTMATQADIDALTTALTADDAAIATEIANLQAANPNLDLSALTAAVAATAALVPAATTSAAPGVPAAGQ
jgi:hypothetical protein